MITLERPELVAEKLVTGEELLAMGDIGRTELIDGRIVYMPPTSGGHGYFEGGIGAFLDRYVRPRKLGWVLTGEVGIYIRRNPDTIRAADVCFVSRQQVPERPRQGYLQIAPELVVQIISPRDTWEEVQTKLEDYFSIGIQRVWVVHPDQEYILVYRTSTDSTKIGKTQTLRGEGTLEGFNLSLAELFEN